MSEEKTERKKEWEDIREKFRQEIEEVRLLERLRIWEGLYFHSSIKILKDGDKTSQVFFIGVPKLEEIVLPPMPDWFQDMDPKEQPALLAHPSLVLKKEPTKEIEQRPEREAIDE